MKLRYPTPLSVLLADDNYQKYFDRKPKTIKAPQISPNWMVLAHTHDDQWKRKLVSDYREAQEITLKLISKTDKYRDVCLFSRKKEFTEPSFLRTSPPQPFEVWCGRCRRPTLFQTWYDSEHHALPNAPIVLPGIERCFFCGARKPDPRRF